MRSLKLGTTSGRHSWNSALPIPVAGSFRPRPRSESRSTPLTQRLLDPVERTSEILFGLIMVLTFTSSISVVEGGREETREILVGALACNFAWGLVDAVMFLMTRFIERARNLTTLRAIEGATSPAVAHRLILDGLPPLVSATLSASEVDSLRQRLAALGEGQQGVRISAHDVVAAVGVFLLVFLSTFPVAVPFLIVRNPV